MMNGSKPFTFFEDRIYVTGFRVCDNTESSIRSNAASLMHKAENVQEHATTALKLICLQESIVFNPPLYINDIYHCQSIAHKDIMGFFLAPSYNDRMILVVQDGVNQVIHLYGIQLSSAKKAQEICSLLGETQMKAKMAKNPRKVTQKTIAVKPPSSQTSEIDSLSKTTNGRASEKRSDAIPTLHDSMNSSHSTETLTSANAYLSSPVRNGRTPNFHGSSSLSSRCSGKIPGIVSSDIEHDWDGIRSMSRAQWMEDIDEIISIGYYDDESDSQDKLTSTPTIDGEKSKPVNLGPQNAWMENITYISNDPVRGTHVTSNGSIYMYVAQQVNPRYTNDT